MITIERIAKAAERASKALHNDAVDTPSENWRIALKAASQAFSEFAAELRTMKEDK